MHEWISCELSMKNCANMIFTLKLEMDLFWSKSSLCVIVSFLIVLSLLLWYWHCNADFVGKKQRFSFYFGLKWYSRHFLTYEPRFNPISLKNSNCWRKFYTSKTFVGSSPTQGTFFFKNLPLNGLFHRTLFMFNNPIKFL